MNSETSSADQKALPPMYLGSGKEPRFTHLHSVTSLMLRRGGCFRFFLRVLAMSEVQSH